MLLDHGAEPNAVEPRYGFTPLHLACVALHPPVARRLLDGGADPQLRDLEGRFPADIVRLDLQDTWWEFENPIVHSVRSLTYGGGLGGGLRVLTYRMVESDRLKIAQAEDEMTGLLDRP